VLSSLFHNLDSNPTARITSNLIIQCIGQVCTDAKH
jgi:hypothetical protein